MTQTVTLLPDPEPREATYTVISVDDHLVEPPDLFEGRMPAALVDRAPRVVEMDDGRQLWQYEDQLYANIGLNAVVGRPPEEWTFEPARFDQMRPGAYDVHHRVRDLDLAGIWATVCFPSLLAGFAGTLFARSSDRELGLACVRAWNTWHAEAWAGPYPERIIPLQLPWLGDPVVAAREVEANAARGFKAVSFVESPVPLGLPSLYTSHWDPFLRACEETGTVVCLHTGSSGWTAAIAPEAPIELGASLFALNAISAAADWLWSAVPLRFPGLRIALSEGGIGWVPMLLDRLDYIVTHSGKASFGQGGNRLHPAWATADTLPSEVLRRHFWFCTIDDPSGLALRHRIGVDHIMVEVDYPHSDSTWPDTQELLRSRLAGIPDDEVAAITHGNAARLFRHPLPGGAVA